MIDVVRRIQLDRSDTDSGVILYHGSKVVVRNPEVRVEKFYKDFGPGFYCTKLKQQAVRWAYKSGTPGKLNIYSFHLDNSLQLKRFDTLSEEWLDFVVACRTGQRHSYDIVEGPMADDQIYRYVSAFLSGELTRKQFWVMIEFAYRTHQISFHTGRALQCLKFKEVQDVYFR